MVVTRKAYGFVSGMLNADGLAVIVNALPAFHVALSFCGTWLLGLSLLCSLLRRNYLIIMTRQESCWFAQFDINSAKYVYICAPQEIQFVICLSNVTSNYLELYNFFNRIVFPYTITHMHAQIHTKYTKFLLNGG